MQHLLTNKIVSLTEMRDPAKVITEAGDRPVAVFNKNKVVGYFVPSAAIEPLVFEAASDADVHDALKAAKRKWPRY